MAKAITGRITLNLITGIVVTVVTVFLAISWMAQRQNDQAAAATETMVTGGVEAIAKRLQGYATDYGWWQEAYDAYANHDADWMYANVGTSVEESGTADLMGVLSPDGKFAYGWVADDSLGTPEEILTPAANDGIRRLVADLPVENLAAHSTYLDNGKVVMMIGVSHITPVQTADKAVASELPIFVVGFALSKDRLGELGKTFLINDLRLALGKEANEPRYASFPVITDVDGKFVGRYVWTPPAPGYVILQSVLPPVVGALLLFCAIALWTALRARRLAIALTDSEQQAVVAARTDSMTGLRNRTGFNELLDSPEHLLACSEGHHAIIYLDINGFKSVNDSIGHHGGDELVKLLADRVSSILPPGAMFARIGGDEFAVSLIGKSARETAAGAASAIVHSLDQPFTVHGFEFHVTVAVGYAVATGTGITPSEVVRRADLAMYQAKTAAEREAVAYHSTMETGALEKKQVETALRRAVEEGDLKVLYQPVVRASDLSIVGVEALVRWTSREFGTVSPALFIPVAEETGLIHELGRIVIDRACQDLATWPDLKMAINVSPVQLRDPNFANDIASIVERYGLSPHQFELELTEGILVNNPTIAKRKLATLKDLGFLLALDDFGTGFSSIGYLRQFPFDILKIDRSFVRDIGLNSTANALIQALVSLGDAMDLSVIAEGIENEDQLKLLRLVQCEFVQGFLISRPVSADEITALLARLGEGRKVRLGGGPQRERAVAGAPA